MTRRNTVRASDIAARLIITVTGLLSVVVLLMIFLFLARDAGTFFTHFSVKAFFFGAHWRPVSTPPQFGILPLILGTALVSFGAILIALPLGIGSAIYIAEVAPPVLKEILKPMVELLAGVPSIVIGFIGAIIVSNWVKTIFDLPTGLTALTGAILLAMMAVPTIISISEDAMYAVPGSFKEASYALGATKWQTIRRVIVPAAKSGILASVMIGFGRIIGETMAVLMLTGNAAVIPKSFLDPVRTMTATIAAEMGETVFRSDHYYALFAIGAVLFVITFLINMAADLAINRKTT